MLACFIERNVFAAEPIITFLQGEEMIPDFRANFYALAQEAIIFITVQPEFVGFANHLMMQK